MPFGTRSKDQPNIDQIQTAELKQLKPSFPDRSLSTGPPTKTNSTKSAVPSKRTKSEDSSGDDTDKDYDLMTQKPIKKAPKRAASGSIKDIPNKECYICHAKETSTWRRDDAGNIMCNKCGLRKRKEGLPKKERTTPKKETDPAPTTDPIPAQDQVLSIFGAGPGDNPSAQRPLNQGTDSVSTDGLTDPSPDDPTHPTKPTPKRAKRQFNPITQEPKTCLVCNTDESPAWRKDEDGNALCNRCMLRQKRAKDSAGRKYKPRAKPVIPIAKPEMEGVEEVKELVIPIDPALTNGDVQSAHHHQAKEWVPTLILQPDEPEPDPASEQLNALLSKVLGPDESEAAPFRPQMPDFN